MNMVAAMAEAARQRQSILTDDAAAKRAAREWLRLNAANESKLVAAVALLLQQAARAEQQ
jgi:hypothetical protein